MSDLYNSQERKAYNYLKKMQKLDCYDEVDYAVRVIKGCETVDQLDVARDWFIRLGFEWWHGKDHLDKVYAVTRNNIHVKRK